MSDEPLVRLTSARFRYVHDGRPGSTVGPFDLSIAQGKMTAVMGPSGSGKSTLLGLMAGLLKPTDGEVSYAPDSGGCSMVLQSHAVHPYLLAWENVATAFGPPHPIHKEKSSAILGRLDLADIAENRSDRLSGGQRQRLAFARAMASGRSLIVADEPTGNLDKTNADLVLQACRTALSDGRTIVLATHDSAVADACDEVFNLTLTMETRG